MPARFRSRLAGNTAELSRLLTGVQTGRDGGYLGRPHLLSAYLRYFLPWNVFRLGRLFDLLEQEGLPALSPGDALTDLGSGPLTLPIALWIARPDFRELPLEIRCIDHTGAALEAGKKIFHAISGEQTAWKIKTIRGPLDTRGKKAILVTAVNVFNEIYPWGNSGAGSAAGLLLSQCAKDGAILVMEPGNPRGGAFIAALRAALLERGRAPLSPCPHCGPCPLPGGRGPGGGKAKWCHFAFPAEDAPEGLRRLSAAAGIPKERAVLSFVLAGPQAKDTAADSGEKPGPELAVRIVSDSFTAAVPVPGSRARYGCCKNGLVLAAGNREKIEKAVSGTLLKLSLSGDRDPRTGALLAPVL